MLPISSVLIVGGGSSGWMTATMLSKGLPDLKITLIESSDIPIIGVGESTNMTMRTFLRFAGINEATFMRASNAAYKVGIRFENFNRIGGKYYHPFQDRRTNPKDFFKPQVDSLAPTKHLADLENRMSAKAPRAFQVDAGLFAEHLKIKCKERGVTHIVDAVRDVVVSEKEGITRIETGKSGPLTADLYVDCTGFRSLLLAKALKEKFNPVTRFLLNDRAVATRMPYLDKNKELKTYTNCTALSSGWVWSIPLWSRVGTGYVYSSNFLSPQAAEAELRKHLGEERVKDLEFRDIEIRAGRHERAWVKNCVGIGISYGFLEPLESTGLSLTAISVFDLTTSLLSETNQNITRAIYNKRQAELFDTTRDFILAHFALTSRDDSPYWRYIRDENPITDGLAEVLDFADRGSFEPLNNRVNLFYGSENWNYILSGMGFFDNNGAPLKGRARFPQSEVHAKLLAKTVYAKKYVEPKTSNPPRIEGAPKWAPIWASIESHV